MALLAIASVITVVQRFVYVYRHADARRSRPARGTPACRSILSRKDVSSG